MYFWFVSVNVTKRPHDSRCGPGCPDMQDFAKHCRRTTRVCAAVVLYIRNLYLGKRLTMWHDRTLTRSVARNAFDRGASRGGEHLSSRSPSGWGRRGSPWGHPRIHEHRPPGVAAERWVRAFLVYIGAAGEENLSGWVCVLLEAYFCRETTGA